MTDDDLIFRTMKNEINSISCVRADDIRSYREEADQLRAVQVVGGSEEELRGLHSRPHIVPGGHSRHILP